MFSDFRCKISLVAVTAIVWLQSSRALAGTPPGSVDLLDAFRFRSNDAVEVSSSGFCQTREVGERGHSPSDVAYKLTRKAVISVPTASAFPSKHLYDIYILESVIVNHFRWVPL